MIKWVIKVWVLAGATNGYVKKFESVHKHRKGIVGLCSRVVLNLMEGLYIV